MSKYTRFPGQPVLGQVLKLIPRDLVTGIARGNNSDRYYKRFKTYEHVLTMVYAILSQAECLREVETGMLAAGNRLQQLQMRCYPRRSTLSDANRSRSSQVFGKIYLALYQLYRPTLPDSHPQKKLYERLKMVDSTTIQLFSEILTGAGRPPVSGKKKGGIKVHTILNAKEDVPQVVYYSSAVQNDGPFLNKMGVNPGDIVVFNRGYNNYQRYRDWSKEGIWFITRPNSTASYEVESQLEIPSLSDQGVTKDQVISISLRKTEEKARLRSISYHIPESGKNITFWTNIFFLNADMVADLYRQRWQIELLFKRLKQNNPLRYFLGDNRNAIEIQIWATLISHLLMKVVMGQIKRKWAFSNLCAMIRHHLFTYIDLYQFLEAPERSLRNELKRIKDPQLFPT